jgi:peroxiredoxin
LKDLFQKIIYCLGTLDVTLSLLPIEILRTDCLRQAQTDIVACKDLGNFYNYRSSAQLEILDMKNLFLSLLLVTVTSTAFAQNPYEKYKRNWKGKQLPDISLVTLDNQQLDNKSLRGKVVLLNFWFTSCPGCKVEYPGLQTLKERFQDQEEVVFISIANDDAAYLENFLKKNPLNFNHIASGKPIADKSFKVLGYPTNIIVDQNGIVQHVKIGGSPQSADDIEYEMKMLLKNN